MSRPLPDTLIAAGSAIYQLRLPIETRPDFPLLDEPLNIVETLACLLKTDLTFKGQKTAYATHNIHAFAAKFPPQLPRLFINELTRPDEWVLDPMAGSGTTLVEAMLTGRRGIGIDLDPLATLLARVKSTPFDLRQCDQEGQEVLRRARTWVVQEQVTDDVLCRVYSPTAVQFFRYWFEEHTVNELHSLAQAISIVANPDVRSFLQAVFSSVIITKSGGVTRARDLAHSRPHRDLNKRVERNALDIFAERIEVSLGAMATLMDAPGRAHVIRADARRLPLPDHSVHLIVTSPPYAANAIDYMRAHKFSLMWLGHAPEMLTNVRRQYIGAELRAQTLEVPSDTANRVIHDLAQRDERRAAVVAYYFRDLEASLREMLRVTAYGRAVILVVGSSTICGIGIKVPAVTAELAVSVGFHLVGVARREIVRDARMMPISHRSDRNGIEARMHEEGVIGLIKPEGDNSAATRRDHDPVAGLAGSVDQQLR